MREISTEKIKVGEHVLIDGVEYMANRADIEFPCKGCAFENGPKPCPDFIECEGLVFEKVKKEPKYRPYKDTAEMIADWTEKYGYEVPSTSMPLIWIWDKVKVEKTLVIGFRWKDVNTADAIIGMASLLQKYTYLDGSPCGKEVTE